MTPDAFLELAVNIAFALVSVSIAMGFYRIAKGPSFGDRVVALDMMTISIMGFCGLFAILGLLFLFLPAETAFLDVAIVLALIGFLTTLALARFAERRRQDGEEADK